MGVVHLLETLRHERDRSHPEEILDGHLDLRITRTLTAPRSRHLESPNGLNEVQIRTPMIHTYDSYLAGNQFTVEIIPSLAIYTRANYLRIHLEPGILYIGLHVHDK